MDEMNVAVNDTIDVSEAETKYAEGFKPRVPENTYRIVKVSSVEFSHSERTGNPMFTWVLTVVDGLDTEGRGTDFKHWTVTNNASFVGFLNALGINRQLTPELYDEQGKLIRSKFEAEALNRMVKVYITWTRSLKATSEDKEPTELTDADYWFNLTAKRVYPVEPIGSKFTGEMSIPVANTNNDVAPFM